MVWPPDGGAPHRARMPVGAFGCVTWLVPWAAGRFVVGLSRFRFPMCACLGPLAFWGRLGAALSYHCVSQSVLSFPRAQPAIRRLRGQPALVPTQAADSLAHRLRGQQVRSGISLLQPPPAELRRRSPLQWASRVAPAPAVWCPGSRGDASRRGAASHSDSPLARVHCRVGAARFVSAWGPCWVTFRWGRLGCWVVLCLLWCWLRWCSGWCWWLWRWRGGAVGGGWGGGGGAGGLGGGCGGPAAAGELPHGEPSFAQGMFRTTPPAATHAPESCVAAGAAMAPLRARRGFVCGVAMAALVGRHGSAPARPRDATTRALAFSWVVLSACWLRVVVVGRC